MGVLSVTRHAFNRGILSGLGLARTDIEKLRLAAETMVNWIPRVLGSMMLRPGLGWIGSTKDNGVARHIPFVKSSTVTSDQAIIELTDGAMRVRVDEAIVTRAAVSSAIRGGDFAADITQWNKIANPGTLPTNGGDNVAFSPDGQFMAVAHADSPYVTIYQISGSTFTKLADPGTLPTGNAHGVSFSPNGQFLAVAHSTTPFVTIYQISGTTFTKLSNPGTLPTGTGFGASFSPNSDFLAVAHNTTPFITIYAVSGTTFTKLANPGSLPAGNGTGAAFSQSGQFLAVSCATSPYVAIYSISGSTFTKLSDPGTLPTNAANAVAFSRDGRWLAVAHGTSPFITIYSISGTTFTKITDPGTLPTGTGGGCAFSPDSQFLAVGHATTPFITIYDFATGAPVKVTNPGTLPASSGNGPRFSPDGRWLAIAHASSPFVTIYEAYQWLDRDDTSTTSSYGAGTTSTAAGPNTLGTTVAAHSATTIRQVIDAGIINISGSRVSVTFGADGAAGTFAIDKAYIGHAALTGDSYDFATTPTALTFSGGSAGFSTTTTITSDEVAFNLDPTRALIISFHTTVGGGAGIGDAPSITGWSCFTKAGDDATTVDATGYTTVAAATSSVLGVVSVQAIASGTAGYLSLVGNRYSSARRTQAVSIAPADQAVEHALRVVVARGVVTLKVGTTYQGVELIDSVDLKEGTHSLAFTPNAAVIFIEVSSSTVYASLLDSVTIEAAGDMVLTTPWTAADLPYVRWEQSADVIFCARYGVQQRRIERRATRSWSIVKYLADDGPFRVENTDDLKTMTASAKSGDVTITSSKPFFKSTHVGGIMQLQSSGQSVSINLGAAAQWSNPIKVTGVGTARKFSITITGTFSATITLQKSLSAPGNWVDVSTYTSATSTPKTDGLDNQTIYYRIGIDTGGYTSGSAVATLDFDQGQIKGVVRFTAYTSPTVMSAIVLTELGGTDATEVWAEGLWSDYRGWPSAVTIHEGRLFWAGKDQILGSVSDAYSSFDPDLDSGDVGDSTAINRTLGQGPTDRIQWLMPLARLAIGADGAEWAARSSSLDEPLTPKNFNLKSPSSVGAGDVGAVKIDAKAIFVSRTLTRVFEMAYDPAAYDYGVNELTLTVPDLCDAGIVAMAIQRYPDTRIHCVLDDGTAAVLVYDRAEKVLCWLKVETPGASGLIEDVVVMPGTPEDKVYYTVNRTIGGNTVRYFEKWAQETECQGGTLNKQADSFITFTQAPSSTIHVGSQLIGQSVVVWADGKCLTTAAAESGTTTNVATFVVDGSGNITVTDNGSPYLATTGVVGLAYEARFKSGKLAISLGGGPGLNIRKKLVGLGLCMLNTHARGLRYGDDFTTMRGLPTVEQNKPVDPDAIWDSYDHDLFSTGGNWSTDSRLCLQAAAPRPATVLAATMAVDSSG
jgi:WD40 repeat protein